MKLCSTYHQFLVNPLGLSCFLTQNLTLYISTLLVTISNTFVQTDAFYYNVYNRQSISLKKKRFEQKNHLPIMITNDLIKFQNAFRQHFVMCNFFLYPTYLCSQLCVITIYYQLSDLNHKCYVIKFVVIYFSTKLL